MLVTTRSADAMASPIDNDVLYEITARLANSDLRTLCTSGLWPRVKLLSQDQNWWHARVCHLLRRPIPIEKARWQHIYNSLVLHERKFHANQDWKCPVLVRLLLEEGADPSIPITYDERRHIGKLYRLISRAPRMIRMSPLILYSRAGNVEAVQLLLADQRVDPTLEEGGLAIQEACIHSRIDVLQLLLRDGRADPCARKNEAFRRAMMGHQAEVLGVLFTDPRVQPPSMREKWR